MSKDVKFRIILLYSLILFLFIPSVTILFLRLSANPMFLSLGVLAIVLGAKHGLDADHISAIDNATRKLMNEGKKPVTTGFFFSLGHSTSVIILVFLIALTGREIDKILPLYYTNILTVLSTGFSAGFLYLLGFMNLIILLSIIKLAKHYKDYNDKFEEELSKRGFMNRYFKKLFNIIKNTYQMYFVGLLFGLGFDTGTEAVILGLGGTLAAAGHPLIDIMILPLLFSTTMVLVDTTDGVLMTLAYNWALINPIRKLKYNITMTSVSIFLAFIVGTIEWIQVISMQLGINGGVFRSMDNLSFSLIGGIIAVLFIIIFSTSILLSKLVKINID
jgi:high-affinity nickel-transport protein